MHKGKKTIQKTEKKKKCVNKDYIWRFHLDNISNERIDEDLTVKYIRRQLEELLNFVVLTYNKKKVQIDGFKLIKDLDINYNIFVKSNNDFLHKTSQNLK